LSEISGEIVQLKVIANELPTILKRISFKRYTVEPKMTQIYDLNKLYSLHVSNCSLSQIVSVDKFTLL